MDSDDSLKNEAEARAAIAATQARLASRLRMVERLAQEVMGWHVVDEDADEWLDADSRHAAPRTWNPLLDISAAMQMVDRLNSKRWWFTAAQYGSSRWLVGAYSEGEEGKSEGEFAQMSADTLQEAICQVALELTDV